MIYSTIIHCDEYCTTGDNSDDAYYNSKNSITFDGENFIVRAEKAKGEGEHCSILFTLTPQLIRELKNLISTIEIMELEQ